jgi:TRAP-type C4-dicarboxylate transport system permease small subunit
MSAAAFARGIMQVDVKGCRLRQGVWVLEWIDRFVRQVEQVLICIAVPVMLVLGILQIISRFVIKAPISWTEQLLTVFFVWTSYLGASIAVANHGHFEVDIFVGLLPAKPRKIVSAAVDVVILLFCLFMIQKGGVLFERTANQRMAMLPFSIRWAYFCIPVSALGMAIHSAARVFREIAPLFSHPRPAKEEKA